MRLSAYHAVFLVLVARVLSQDDSDEFDCEGNPSDVIFLLDASNSIWGPDFSLQLRFVSHVVRRFKIGQDHMKVGVVTFSDAPVEQLKLMEHKHAIKDAITAIKHDGGVYTYTDAAIHYLRTTGLSPDNGAREGVTRIAIVITDGRSYNTTATAREAALARQQGIHMFAIGVGYSYDVDELYSIASEPYQQYIFRARSYRTLDRLKDLLAVQACTVTDPPTTLPPSTTPMPTTTTTTATTTTTTTPTTTTTQPVTTSRLLKLLTAPPTSAHHDHQGGGLHGYHGAPESAPFMGSSRRFLELQGGRHSHSRGPVGDEALSSGDHYGIDSDGNLIFPPFGYHRGRDTRISNQIMADSELPCRPRSPTDVVFVIDEKEGGASTVNHIWTLIRDMIKDLDMTADHIRVRFVQECPMLPGMQLGQHRNKNTLLAALDALQRQPSATHELLESMSQNQEGPEENTIEGHRKTVGVYLTDGASGDLRATLTAAQQAKIANNIQLFGVGIGDRVDTTELRAMVSCGVEDHLFLVPQPESLGDIRRKLITQLCRDAEP